MNEIIDKAIEELSGKQDQFVTKEEAARIDAAIGMLEQFGKDWDARAQTMKEANWIDFDPAWNEAHMVNQFYELGRARGYGVGYKHGYDKGEADTIIKL